MKYLITLLVIFLQIPVKTNAQYVTQVVHLTDKKKLTHIHQLPFNKVVVFDNRLDTAKIGLIAYNNLRIIKLDQPVPLAIEAYIEKKLSKFRNNNGVLYISVKELRFKFSPVLLFFSADAYLQTDSGFEKIASVKKNYRMSNGEFSDIGRYNKTIGKAINSLIKNVSQNYPPQNNINTKKYTIDSINSIITNNWLNYPIIKQSAPSANGVYRTFNDFRNNNIELADFSFKMDRDSTYTLNFLNDADRKKWGDNSDIYALCYNGILYINITRKYLLPVLKVNNALYFHIPSSLPNMYSIFLASLITNYHGAPNTQNTTNVYGAISIIVIDAVLQGIFSAKKENTKQKILNQGLASGDMRTCFIDMDTGEIIY